MQHLTIHSRRTRFFAWLKCVVVPLPQLTDLPVAGRLGSGVSPHAHMRRVLVFLLFLTLLSGCRVTPPAQDELAKEFRANRQSYEVLKDMVLADKLSAVAFHGKEFARRPLMFEAPELAGISAQRAKEYRRLMLAADVQRVDVTEDGDVLISMASWGMANRGWRVSAMWRKSPPESVLPSLDDFSNSSNDWQVGYSRAADSWYFRIVW